jgi:hypothetical protein
MEYGRALLWAHRHSPAWPDAGSPGLPALLHDGLPAAVQDGRVLPATVPGHARLLQSVCNAAAARFWHLLQDFAQAHPASPWLLPPDHPFLCVRRRTLTVQVPASPPVQL